MNPSLVNELSLGKGSPVILVHGMAASLRDWSALAPDLAGEGFGVHALDLLGHGGSHKPDDPSEYHIESIYAHLSQWIESLRLSEPALMVGHSLGGYLCLLHAIRQSQRVRGLVLVDPLYDKDQLSPLLRLANHRPAVGGVLMRLVPHWLVRTAMGLNADVVATASIDVRQQIAIDYKRASPNFVYIARHIPDLTPRLAHIKAPALVLWGDRDRSLKPSSFPPLVRALPDARGFPVRHAGHQPHLSQYDQVKPAILAFLQGLA